MVPLTKEETLYVYRNSQYKDCNYIYKDNKKYYFKISNNPLELVAKKLADSIDITCANYEINSIGIRDYYFSEDLGTKEKMVTLRDLGISEEKESLYDIWNELEKKYPNQIEYIMNKIVKIYIFDLLFLNSDRTFGNLGLLLDGNSVSDVVILDNEAIFDRTLSTVLTSKLEYWDKLKDSRISDILNTYKNIMVEFGLKKNIEDVEYFLKTSSIEYRNLFLEIYSKFPVYKIRSIMYEIYLQNNGNFTECDDLINTYEINYELIGNLIKKWGIRNEYQIFKH